jgi:hypothetical protein
LLQHWIENRANEFLEVGQGSHALLDSILLEDETLIITKKDIIEFKDKLTMY